MRRNSIALAAAALVMASPVHAAILVYSGPLLGSSESPANASAGSGIASVSYDNVAHTIAYNAGFTGLTGTTTAAHVHCCTAVPAVGNAGVATTTPSFPGFPLGVTAGAFVNTFDLTLPGSWNAAFVTANGGTLAGAEAALAAGLASGRAYFNIHTSAFGGGEIRANLAAVPEPATWLTMLLGFGLIGGTLRLARRRAGRASLA